MGQKDPVATGAMIARRRHQLDMTQIELAKALGVSPSTVANWERGVSYPSRKIGKIEQLLGSLDEPPRGARGNQDLDEVEAHAQEVLAATRRMRAERELRAAEERRKEEDGEPERRAAR